MDHYTCQKWNRSLLEDVLFRTCRWTDQHVMVIEQLQKISGKKLMLLGHVEVEELNHQSHISWLQPPKSQRLAIQCFSHVNIMMRVCPDSCLK